MPLPPNLTFRRSLDRLRARTRQRDFVPEMIAAAGMFVLGFGLLRYLKHDLEIPRRVLSLGILGFVAGAWAFKGVLYQGLVVPVLHKKLKPAALAASQGLVSAVSELGAAALILAFLLPALTPPEVLAFGAMAGIIEALMLAAMTVMGLNALKGTPLEVPADEQWEAFGATPLRAALYPILERALCIGLHTGTRALIYTAIARRNPLPALLALAIFAAGDGVAYYGYLRHWKFLTPRVALPMYGFIAFLAALSLGSYAWFIR